jgi:hypothetical protein
MIFVGNGEELQFYVVIALSKHSKRRTILAVK